MPIIIRFFDGHTTIEMEKQKFIETYPDMAQDLFDAREAKDKQEKDEHERYKKLLQEIKARIDKWNKKAKYHPIDRGTLEVYLTEGMQPNYPDPW